MPWPHIRPRFTIRGLMAAVAVVGVLLGLFVMRARSAAYQKIALQCAGAVHGRMQANGHVKTTDGRTLYDADDENFWLQHAWRSRMANKYWKLSLRPWLTLGPDPPRPGMLAHPRPAVDCPVELTLSDPMRCEWCKANSWACDQVYPWWTIPWTWPPERLYRIPRYSFPWTRLDHKASS